jgi:NAD-dependent deacetylase
MRGAGAGVGAVTLDAVGRPLIAFLTGAGISTDSGIPDYRGPNGLWRRDPDAEKLVTFDYYMADPEIRRRSWRLRQETAALGARPNVAHQAIADLGRSGRADVWVITQNTDGLHQEAGTPPDRVLELHGSARAVVCTRCGDRTPMRDALDRVTGQPGEPGEPDPPCRACGGILKAATVMFGEGLDREVLSAAVAVAGEASLFFAVGSSLQVYPAAGLVDLAATGGARLVIVNADPTPYDPLAAQVVREPIGTALPVLLDGLKVCDTE